MRSIAALAALCALLAISAPASSQNAASEAFDILQAKTDLDSLERVVDQRSLNEAAVGAAIQATTVLRTRFNQCATAAEGQFASAKSSLDRVQPTLSPEAKASSEELRDLNAQATRLEEQATECRLLALRADRLIGDLTAAQQHLLTERLLSPGRDAVDLTMDFVRAPTQWGAPAWTFLKEHSGVHRLTPPRIAFLAFWLIASGAFGWWLGRVLSRIAAHIQVGTLLRELILAACTTFSRYTPILLMLVTASIYLAAVNWDQRPPPFINLFIWSITAFVAALATVRTLLNPAPPARQATTLPDNIARAMAARIRVLLVVLLVVFILFLTPLSASLSPHIVGLTRLVMLTLLVLNAGWLLWLLGNIPRLQRSGRGLRGLMLLVLVGIAGVDWLGFQTLATFLLIGLGQTAVLAAVFWLMLRIFDDTFDGLDVGRFAWQQRVRSFMGLRPEEPMPGLIWLRALVGLVLWGSAGLTFLRIWGLSDAGFAILVEYLVDGFEVFGLTIVPSKVVLGLLLFALLLTLGRGVTKVFETKAAFRMRLDAGAREAIIKITGYLAFIIALLVGLSVAGVDFSNIAIVAGALSVGIGFGLQNIVNNFVSGLILLFERPIRTGDWIMVGGTEGWVTKISVRSTEIRTFDRSHVIVPNADLISNPVTNWTLHDRYGRVLVDVPVVYGSDVQAVKQALIEVAKSHPAVVDDEHVGRPAVQFVGFGAAALTFRLQCFVRNVSERVQVISDLYFAIEQAFRERGINVPTPPRSVIVQEAEEKKSAKKRRPPAEPDND